MLIGIGGTEHIIREKVDPVKIKQLYAKDEIKHLSVTRFYNENTNHKMCFCCF